MRCGATGNDVTCGAERPRMTGRIGLRVDIPIARIVVGIVIASRRCEKSTGSYSWGSSSEVSENISNEFSFGNGKVEKSERVGG